MGRGMLRGSLDRSTPRGARHLAGKAAAAVSVGGVVAKARAAAALLPLATIPVIQASVRAEGLPPLDKKDTSRSIDVAARAYTAARAHAVAYSSAQPDSPADLQLRRSPSGGSLVGSATAAQAAQRRSKLAAELS